MAEVKDKDQDVGADDIISEEEEESEDEDPKPQDPPHGYMTMFHPDKTAEYLETQANWWKFSIPLGLYYCLQFGLALCCANAYSDMERKNTCGGKKQEESAAVYDMALFLLGVFHIVEWVRTALLLSCTCMEGMGMLMWTWHITTPINALFGVVCYIYAHYARFSAAGVESVENQPSRAKFLVAQVLFFYIVYILAALFVFSFPKVSQELAMRGWVSRKAKSDAEKAQKEADE